MNITAPKTQVIFFVTKWTFFQEDSVKTLLPLKEWIYGYSLYSTLNLQEVRGFFLTTESQSL